MKKELTVQEARFKAEAYCSASEHCKFEVFSKLRQWGIAEESWESIVHHLEEERYIVVLEKREKYCLLVTAFYIEHDHTLDKKLKKYEAYAQGISEA